MSSPGFEPKSTVKGSNSIENTWNFSGAPMRQPLRLSSNCKNFFKNQELMSRRLLQKLLSQPQCTNIWLFLFYFFFCFIIVFWLLLLNALLHLSLLRLPACCLTLPFLGEITEVTAIIVCLWNRDGNFLNAFLVNKQAAHGNKIYALYLEICSTSIVSFFQIFH